MDKLLTKDKKALGLLFLKKLGKKNPSEKELKLTEKILFSTITTQSIYFNEQLSQRETHCLLLAAKGLSSAETAILLEIKQSTVQSYRRSILKKLSCKTLAQAVYEGICLGAFRSSDRNKGTPIYRESF